MSINRDINVPRLKKTCAVWLMACDDKYLMSLTSATYLSDVVASIPTAKVMPRVLLRRVRIWRLFHFSFFFLFLMIVLMLTIRANSPSIPFQIASVPILAPV